MYQFKEEISPDQFFRFDKKWIKNMNWAMLPKASKAVMPVIAAHCNEAGESFPSERTISILSGRSDKKVRDGTNGLVGFPGFELFHYVNKRGRRAKKYKISFPPEREQGRCFFFHKIIIEGGNWCELRPVAQALYPVMRYFAYFDQAEYLEHEEPAEDIFTDGGFKALYEERKWDLCEAEIAVMAEYANIKRPSVYTALQDLESNYLIEDFGRNDAGVQTWKVFIIPPYYWNRDSLNKKLMNRYGVKDDN